MNLLRNLLALIGAAAVAMLIYCTVAWGPWLDRVGALDDRAMETYAELFKKVLETGNGAEATVWKVKVEEGLTAADVEETMRSVAAEHNIKNVGELPLSKQVEAMSGKPYRYVKIFMFCNALTAAQMLDYNDAYSAYLPCRVTLVEDPQGQLWIYSLNMDLMIYGGAPLPKALREEALRVKRVILDIMNRGAAGEF
ncbi:MAG TPA: DUF302 domain-containing protein [Thiotrichales bacterium]|nr:DUF302 domain-containing protein [Thiotrichales bacterium]